MKYFIGIIFLFIVSLTACTQQPSRPNALHNGKLEDGIYLLLNEFQDPASAKAGKGMLIDFNPDFIDTADSEQAYVAEVDTIEYVPIRLSAPPDTAHHEERNNTKVMLSLNDESSDMLEELTGKNLGKRVAIVIGGQVTTAHGIKAKITGGKLQITRCTDNACEKLYFELKNNVKE